MSDVATLTPAEDDDAFAAEYAMGLLQGSDAAAAAERMMRDTVFAAAVRAWQEWLAPLAETLAPVEPPARVKQAIDRVLPGQAGKAAVPSPLTRVRLWLAGAVAAAGVAVAALILVPMVTPDRPNQVAELTLPNGTARLEAAVFAPDHAIEVRLAEGSLPTEGDVEMWWIGPNAAPISLGLAPRQGLVRVILPASITSAEGVTLALSAEPTGGSPTGQPTGPILTTAPLTTL